jgi:hypothetical protein
MDHLLFPLGMGDYDVTITLSRNGKRLTYSREARRPDGPVVLSSLGSLSDDAALDTLPEWHLLTDEAMTNLGGGG